MIHIREITPDDAGKLLKLMQELDREAYYLLYEPGERPMDEEALREHIRKLESPRFGTFFVAEATAVPETDTFTPETDTFTPQTDTFTPQTDTATPETDTATSETDAGTLFAGYLEVRRLPWARVRHRAYLVIGILKRYGGKGLGTRFMREVESWARKHGIRRLYLTLIAENKAAVALYRKMGYEIEGRHPASMRLGDRFVEELTMGKWL